MRNLPFREERDIFARQKVFVHSLGFRRVTCPVAVRAIGFLTNAAWPKTIGLCDTSHPSISPDRARARRWTLRGRVREVP
jgi:hypothetical protein